MLQGYILGSAVNNILSNNNWASLIVQLVKNPPGMQETLVWYLVWKDLLKSYPLQYSWTSLVAQLVKNPPAMEETWIWSLGWEDPWRSERPPTPSFWPGEFHELYSSWGLKEMDMTDWLSLLLTIINIHFSPIFLNCLIIPLSPMFSKFLQIVKTFFWKEKHLFMYGYRICAFIYVWVHSLNAIKCVMPEH